MAVRAPNKVAVQRDIEALRDDFDEHPKAVLNSYGPDQRVMARGNSKLHVIQFIIHHDVLEIARGNIRECLDITSVTDGAADYSAAAKFVLESDEFEVTNVSPRRLDHAAAVRSAQLLAPAALEAEPLPIDREVAQLFVDTMAFRPYRESR